MKRDPSIHVRRSSLSEALEDIVQGDVPFIINELFHKLNRQAIRNRIIVQPTARTKKTMKRVVSVDKDVAEEFHAVYQMINQQNNIKTTTIKATDGKYTTLKEVAQHAKEFCGMFDLEQANGFQIYVSLGIKLAGHQYSIYKLKALGDKIIKYYESAQTITEDEDGSATVAFYAAWKNVLLKYGHRVVGIEEPHLFVHFIHGRLAADKENAKYEDWISAQFERWASLDSTPELSQFYGDNATLAYSKYMGLKAKNYDTEDEQEYFEEGKVRAKTIKRKESKSKT